MAGTEKLVMLDAYMSVLSCVKHKNKYAVGFVQVKSPVEERRVQFHIIHLVSTTLLSSDSL